MTRVEVKFKDLTIDTKVAPACPLPCACKHQPTNRAALPNVPMATNRCCESCRPSQSCVQVYVGNRALPSVVNAYRNALEVGLWPCAWCKEDCITRTVIARSHDAEAHPADDVVPQACMLHASAGCHLPCGHQAGAEAAVSDTARSQWHHQAGMLLNWKHSVLHSNLYRPRQETVPESHVTPTQGRMTLLLGPPGAGKTTLLKALAGKLSHSNLNVSHRSISRACGKTPNVPSLAAARHIADCCKVTGKGCAVVQVTGEVTYNGHTLDEFFPQRTASYVEQTDQHIAELTVGLACIGSFMRSKHMFGAYCRLLSALLRLMHARCAVPPALCRCTRHSTLQPSARAWGTSTVMPVAVLGLDDVAAVPGSCTRLSSPTFTGHTCMQRPSCIQPAMLVESVLTCAHPDLCRQPGDAAGQGEGAGYSAGPSDRRLHEGLRRRQGQALHRGAQPRQPPCCCMQSVSAGSSGRDRRCHHACSPQFSHACHSVWISVHICRQTT